ncbi:hypothetical protein [Phaeovulum vinaykumarii]|uniref:AAA+ family ATPase n=1 Tax=Phaeovulum vinaykumarii TaxID=407234 RepID=A0A1N7K5F4_9RHOB|nr:hypothetical protein [Phaeovulum vinaykumarii]SIS56771.1 hypothetical protein SAMN05421795_101626 [Phaeovulum vinaykumarii]SOB93165.1 hypothetical protein SAMN05878426_101623 [Phaeovulum vinaykumarii]
MKHALLSPALIAALLAAPLAAEEAAPQDAPPSHEDGSTERGFSLMEEGARLLMQGLADKIEPKLGEIGRGLDEAMADIEPALRELAEMIGDLRNYEPPERLPNGDIILRRKRDLPAPDAEPAPGTPFEL